MKMPYRSKQRSLSPFVGDSCFMLNLNTAVSRQRCPVVVPRIAPGRAERSGCCCLFSLSCKNRSKELVPELSLGFCATGLNYEQLPRHLRAIRSAFASHLFCPKELANQEAWNDAKQFLLDQLREVLSKASWDVARLRRRNDQH